MKYLAIETSGKLCGACITEDYNLIDKIEIDNGLTHSQNLMPLIQELLDKNKIQTKDINGFICDIGPGSFTGIRIGVATAKAFVDSFDNKKFTGVSSLEALAYNVKTNGLICSIIDCKNGNCYFALYSLNDSSLIELISPVAVSVEELCSQIKSFIKDNAKNFENKLSFIGDGAVAYKDIIKNNIENACFDENVNIDTYHLALAGIKKIDANSTLELLPLYLKKPQAERVLEEKKTPIKISKMTETDLNALKNSLISDFDDFWSFNSLQQEFKNDTSHLFVVKSNSSVQNIMPGQDLSSTTNSKSHINDILGFVSVQFIIDEATITNIVTKKACRNQGIGSKLLEFITDYCKSNNMKTLTLEVNENNTYALKLYKKYGFKQIGLRKNYYNGIDNAIIMNLDI